MHYGEYIWQSPLWPDWQYDPRNFVIQYLNSLKAIGVNHVGLNLKYENRPAHEVVQEMGKFVVPEFPAHAVSGC